MEISSDPWLAWLSFSFENLLQIISKFPFFDLLTLLGTLSKCYFVCHKHSCIPNHTVVKCSCFIADLQNLIFINAITFGLDLSTLFHNFEISQNSVLLKHRNNFNQRLIVFDPLFSSQAVSSKWHCEIFTRILVF